MGPDFLAPARRASTMLMVIGGLGILMGMCTGASSFAAPPEQYQTMIQEYSKMGLVVTESFLRGMVIATGVVAGISGVILLFLGILVRRGSKAATVFAVILCGLALLLLGLMELSGLLNGLKNPMLMATACVLVVPLALVGLATMWLIQALKALPQVDAARQQWQASYATSRQQQSHYQSAPSYGQTGGIPPQHIVQPPAAMRPSIGYGAMPPVQPPDENAPPTRHPPLPPDQQNPL